MAFYPWIDDENIGQSKLVPTADQFETDSQRSEGFEGGKPASSMRVNAALRQANLVACALMKASNNTSLSFLNTVEEVEQALIAKTGANAGAGLVKVQQSISGQMGSAPTGSEYGIASVGIDANTGYLAFTYALPDGGPSGSLVKSISSLNSSGKSNKYARADHVHSIDGSIISSAVQSGSMWGIDADISVAGYGPISAGISTKFARADHQHQLFAKTSINTATHNIPNTEVFVTMTPSSALQNSMISLFNYKTGSTESFAVAANALVGGISTTSMPRMTALPTMNFSDGMAFANNYQRQFGIPYVKMSNAGSNYVQFESGVWGLKINGRNYLDAAGVLDTGYNGLKDSVPQKVFQRTLDICAPSSDDMSRTANSSLIQGKIVPCAKLDEDTLSLTWEPTNLYSDIVSIGYQLNNSTQSFPTNIPNAFTVNFFKWLLTLPYQVFNYGSIEFTIRTSLRTLKCDSIEHSFMSDGTHNYTLKFRSVMPYVETTSTSSQQRIECLVYFITMSGKSDGTGFTKSQSYSGRLITINASGATASSVGILGTEFGFAIALPRKHAETFMSLNSGWWYVQ